MAPPPLTASIHDAPQTPHDGTSAFTFELRFSEHIPLSYRTLRDHAFTVTGGEVTKARTSGAGAEKEPQMGDHPSHRTAAAR